MIGKILAAPLMILYWGVGLWGLALTLGYLSDKIGIFFTFLSLLVFPIVYALTPLYAGVVDGYWTPAMVSYAPIAVYMLIALVAGMMSSNR